MDSIDKSEAISKKRQTVLIKAKKHRYQEMLVDPEWIGASQEQMAKALEVTRRTLVRWGKKIDWDEIKTERRKRFASRTVEVDDALIKKAKGGDIRAIEVYYQRFDNWIPATAQHQIHDLDENLIDDELKRLMQLRGDTAAALNRTSDALDGSAGEADAVSHSGEDTPKAG